MKKNEKWLNETQRQMVSDALPLVEETIRNYIFSDRNKPDMNYNDLYQTGCLALCRAAIRYDNTKPFEPYARRAVHNGLIDYCRMANVQPICILDEPVLSDLESTTAKDMLTYPDSEDFYQHCRRAEAILYLKKQQQDSSGGVQKGIYCLLKKAQGYTSHDMSVFFGVRANNIRAWMSLAAKKLRQDVTLHELLSR